MLNVTVFQLNFCCLKHCLRNIEFVLFSPKKMVCEIANEGKWSGNPVPTVPDNMQPCLTSKLLTMDTPFSLKTILSVTNVKNGGRFHDIINMPLIC